MIGNLLLHVEVEKTIAKCFVFDLLGPELVAKLFSHLLRDQLGRYELLRLDKLLFKLHLETHVVLELVLQL